MSATVTDILTRLTMDSSEFNRKIDEAREKVTQLGESGKSSISALGFGFGTLAVAGVTALGYELSKTTDELNELYETSKKLSISTGNLQELQYAFRGFGVSSEQVAKSIQFMQRSLGEAQFDPKGAFGDVFRRINLDASELAKLNPEEQMLRIVKAIRQLNDVTKEQAELRKIFGRGGSSLAGAVNSGELEESINKYKGLGIDNETAENAHKFIEQLHYAEAYAESTAFKIIGSISHWVSNLTQAINTVASTLQSAFNFISKDSTALNAKIGRGIASTTGLGEWHDDRSLLEVFLEKHAPKWLSDQSPFGQVLGSVQSHASDQGLSKTFSNVFGIKDDVITAATKGFKDVSEASEEAATKLKDMSETTNMLISQSKKQVSDALKDLLGNSLESDKPIWSGKQKSSSTGDAYEDMLNSIINQTSNDEYNYFKQQFQKTFKDAQQYGLNNQVKSEIGDLRTFLTSVDIAGQFDTRPQVGAINDLEKFAKEQEKQKDTLEVKVFWSKGLSGEVSYSGEKEVNIQKQIDDHIANAASSMGK